ncbi:amino acid adenylation domain-containing protein, partial [bacterium]|nr:amino acid adenylation domain-containing protein [bacterium]
KDIIVGSTVSGRPGELSGVENMIGPFVNALPLRIIIDDQTSIISQLQTLHERIQNNNTYSYLTMNDLKGFTDMQKDKPMFYSLFAFQNYPKNDSSPLGDLGLEISELKANEKTNYPLWLSASLENVLSLRASYDGDVFPTGNIVRLLGHIQSVLEWISANPEKKVSQADILSTSEKKSKENLIHGPTSKYTLPHKCMQELFHQQAESTPDKIAVKSFYGDLTYKELYTISNRLGHKLLEMGAKPNQLIGVLMEKGWQQTASCLGIQNSGAAYLPISSDWPSDRVNDVLEAGNVEILLTHETVLNKDGNNASFAEFIKIICIDNKNDFSEFPDTPGVTKQKPEDLAYVIFTSGSTGKPKGVMINHIGAVNTILDINMRFNVTEQDRILALSALSFDLSVYDLYGPLYAGGTIVYPDHEYKKDPSHWVKLLIKEDITLWNSVPALMQLLVDNGEMLSIDEKEKLGKTLRVIMMSGDWIPTTLPDRIKSIFNRPDSSAEIIGLGGATEGSIWSIIFPIMEVDPDWVSIPYGKPMINQKMMVLNHNMGYTPINVAGEIYIGGVGVADGYWGNEEETLARFIKHPVLNEQVYRTGDLGRWMSDGNIEFLGRADNQVKIRGYRVELEDIETHIRQHPSIEYSIVMVRKNDMDVSELIACVSYKEKDIASDSEKTDQVESWKLLYERTYSKDEDVSEASLNLAGWLSSYTGESIEESQMKIWVESTVSRILDLKPSRVYEIGCGTGMLLFRVAPKCETYFGTDFSESAIDYVQGNIESLPQVVMQLKEGCDFKNTEKGDFDTVIINSVAQYFPSGDYLLQVIAGAVDLIDSNGYLFLGDFRNYNLLDTYHASIEHFKAGDSICVSDLLKRVKKEIKIENELLVSPELLRKLPYYIPEITGIKIFIKEGNFENELTKYRYDAVLYLGNTFEEFQKTDTIDWKKEKNSISDIVEILKNKQSAYLRIENIINGRLENDIAVSSLLFDGELNGDQKLDDDMIKDKIIKGLNPADFFTLNEKLPDYDIEVTLSHTHDECFDVTFINRLKKSELKKIKPDLKEHRNLSDLQWKNLTSTPLSGTISTTELKDWLKESLPDYMIPSAFVILDEMPLTANGKIDRKEVVKLGNLANIEHKASEHYIAPRTDKEKELCEIWENMLHIPKIGVIDNFFELGGHSLLVAEMAVAVKKHFGTELSFPPFMKNPTVEALAEMLDTGKSSKVSSRYLQQVLDDSELAPEYVKCLGPDANTENPETILITGAGGFLGCHLLMQLLEKTDAKIYCQIRAKNKSTAIHKLKKNLKKQNMLHLYNTKRIIVIHGDLARRNFRVSGLDYVDLGQEVDSIYHCAAKVHHMYDYEKLRSDNVTATLRILKLATQFKNKAIHYISTMGCISEFGEDSKGTENGPAKKPIEEFNGYAMSKWVCEKLLWQARQRGIHVKIYRPGNITGDTVTGACNPFFNHHLLMIKGSLQMGVVPDLTMEVEMTPVDILSKAIVGLSLRTECPNMVYNLENPNKLVWRDYITLLNNAGLKMKMVPYSVWKRQHLDKIDKYNALFALRMLYSDETGAYPEYHVERTEDAMKKIGLAFPDDYQKLINTYWDYNRKIGFIESEEKND